MYIQVVEDVLTTFLDGVESPLPQLLFQVVSVRIQDVFAPPMIVLWHLRRPQVVAISLVPKQDASCRVVLHANFGGQWLEQHSVGFRSWVTESLVSSKNNCQLDLVGIMLLSFSVLFPPLLRSRLQLLSLPSLSQK